jgi:translation initiation factor 2B subunit (eIF-2B alpha/beta/delta family)
MKANNQRVEELLAALAADNRSGAADIMQSAARAFALLDRTSTSEQVIDLCVRLTRAQPAMAPLLNLASNVAGVVTSSVASPANAAAEAAELFATQAAEFAQAASLNASNLIDEGSTVLTHSHSSAVANALHAAARLGKRFSVVATESRPILEGRALAENLLKAGIDVTVIVDAAADAMIGHADLVMVGADYITPDVAINKIGTRSIALAAGGLAVPFYCVCDTSKFIGHEGAPTHIYELERLDRHSPEEVWPKAPAGIKILNRYFDSTPLELVSSVVTEIGLLDERKVRLLAVIRRLHPVLLEAFQYRER